MVRKLFFTSDTVVLTYKLIFWSSQHDLPKSMEMVIFHVSLMITCHFEPCMYVLK
jgi:hypothetical protein